MDLEHEIDVVLQLEIVRARPDVDAVAGVKPHTLFGNAAQCVVQDLDPQRNEFSAFRHAERGSPDCSG